MATSDEVQRALEAYPDHPDGTDYETGRLYTVILAEAFYISAHSQPATPDFCPVCHVALYDVATKTGFCMEHAPLNAKAFVRKVFREGKLAANSGVDMDGQEQRCERLAAELIEDLRRQRKKVEDERDDLRRRLEALGQAVRITDDPMSVWESQESCGNLPAFFDDSEPASSDY